MTNTSAERACCLTADTPFGYTLSLINGKWKMSILYLLSHEDSIRFNELSRLADLMDHRLDTVHDTHDQILAPVERLGSQTRDMVLHIGEAIPHGAEHIAHGRPHCGNHVIPHGGHRMVLP